MITRHVLAPPLLYSMKALLFLLLTVASCALAFERPPNLVPKMTSDYEGAMKSSGSLEIMDAVVYAGASYDVQPWNVFDGNPETEWISKRGVWPVWLSYTFRDGPKWVTGYSIQVNGKYLGRAPGTWTLEAWQNGSWKAIDTRRDEDWKYGINHSFSISQPIMSDRYRFVFIDDNDPRPRIDLIDITEIELYSRPSFDWKLLSSYSVWYRDAAWCVNDLDYYRPDHEAPKNKDGYVPMMRFRADGYFQTRLPHPTKTFYLAEGRWSAEGPNIVVTYKDLNHETVTKEIEVVNVAPTVLQIRPMISAPVPELVSIETPVPGPGDMPPLPAELWLKADDPSCAHSNVWKWKDQGGSQNEATGDPGKEFRTWDSCLGVDKAVNGHRAVRFEGKNFLQLVQPIYMRQFTIFVVGQIERKADQVETNYILGQTHRHDPATGTNLPNGLRWCPGSGTEINIGERPFNIGVRRPTGPSTSPHLLTMRNDNDHLTFYRNGKETGNTLAIRESACFNSIGAVTFELNAHERAQLNVEAGSQYLPWEFGRFLRGDIAEIIVYSRALSQKEMDVTTRYLMDKYGLDYLLPEPPPPPPTKADKVAEKLNWLRRFETR